MLNKVLALGIAGAMMLSFIGCAPKDEVKQNNDQAQKQQQQSQEEKQSEKVSYAEKKVLYVDSYKDDYPWSKALSDYATAVLDKTDVNYKVVRMDTKNNTGEDFKVNAGKMVKEEIDEYQPDVVITADDNAVKYVVQEYLKDAATPVVSIGVNWNGDAYDYPYSNATGLFEVPPVEQTVDRLKELVPNGTKIGFISSDTSTSRKDLDFSKSKFGLEFEKEYFCTDFEDFKTKYVALQDEVDMFLMNNYSGIKNWNDEEAKQFIIENTKVPSGTTYEWVTPYALLGVTTVAKEHGEFAANTALEILDGTAVSNIPYGDNEEGSMYLNQVFAEKLGVTFSPELLNIATVINE